ncbi:MAG: hypothetical protein Q8P02_00910 [Candidatus Micrarchaeota archaeon]|nr:hypothetical protein [Candidatus Micrarchaeota archaeon]
MGLEEALKRPLARIRDDPAVLLPAALSALPLLIWIPGAWWVAQTLAPAWNASGADASRFLAEQGGTLWSMVPTFLGIVLAALAATLIIKAFVSLVLADVAGQPIGKRASLLKAFDESKRRLGSLAWATILGGLAFLVAFGVILTTAIVGIAALASPSLGVLILVVVALSLLVASLAIAFLGAAGFLYLPCIIRYTDLRGLDAVRAAWDFAVAQKLSSILLIILVGIASSILGQVAAAALPALGLYLPLSFIAETVVLAWAGLTAASVYLEYNPSKTRK